MMSSPNDSQKSIHEPYVQAQSAQAQHSNWPKQNNPVMTQVWIRIRSSWPTHTNLTRMLFVIFLMSSFLHHEAFFTAATQICRETTKLCRNWWNLAARRYLPPWAPPLPSENGSPRFDLRRAAISIECRLLGLLDSRLTVRTTLWGAPSNPMATDTGGWAFPSRIEAHFSFNGGFSQFYRQVLRLLEKMRSDPIVWKWCFE